MTIELIKASNFNNERKATMRDVANYISKLNVGAITALKQQAYVRKNPDDNGVEEFKAVLSADIDSIAASLNEVNEKLDEAKPATLGAASRISGVTPAALTALLRYVKRKDKKASAQ